MKPFELSEDHGGALVRVTLTRPERYNAFDVPMVRDLAKALAGTLKPVVRAVLFQGQGPAFCAGGDLRAAVESGKAAERLGTLAREFHKLLLFLRDHPAVVITAVNGMAAGGGFALALAGDLRLGTANARYRLAYGRVGLTMDGGTSWRLPRVVGLANAQRLILEDAEVGADEALRIGLLHRLVPVEQIEPSVKEIVDRLKVQGRRAVGENKALLYAGVDDTLAGVLRREQRSMQRSAGTAEGREGIAAFCEKRPPKFV